MTTLNPPLRRIVLECVLDAIASASPGCFSQNLRQGPGGIDTVEQNLDVLIDIVRHTSATRIEPFQAQILDHICNKCPQQFPGDYCPIRHARLCPLYQNAASIVEAIAETLIEIGDADYLAHHSPDARSFPQSQN